MRALIAAAILCSTAYALPRMSLTAGSPCTTCHVNPSGGGLRNELGFTSMSRTGALTFDQMGLDAIHGLTSNRFAGDVVQTGADIRYQWVRLGRPTLRVNEDGSTETEVPPYELFQMQFQPYLALNLTKWLVVAGSYNATEETWNGEACDEPFNGQRCFDAAVYVTPDRSLPFFRAGMVQPSIGIRHDDHTMFQRSDGRNPSAPLIAPNYAEWGGELGYQPLAWFRADAGVFHNEALDRALNTGRETAELWPVTYLARVQYLPQGTLGVPEPPGDADDEFGDDFDDFEAEPETPINLNGWVGASLYGSGEFSLLNAFAGLGTSLGGAAMLEFARSSRPDYDTLNAMLHLSWALWDWLVVEGRVERAATDDDGAESVTWAYVGGLQFFPIPFVEIRPEYRYVENDVFRFGQATVQLHLFY